MTIFYFPCDGNDPNLSYALYTDILNTTAQFGNEYIIVMRGFNSRVKLLREHERPIPNGDLLDTFSEVSGYTILNNSKKCIGKTIWQRNTQKSSIDYII